MGKRTNSLPRVGVLALTLELYESLAPGLRQTRERWLRKCLLPAIRPHAAITFNQVVFTREQVDAAVASLEHAGADVLLVVLLTYAPSQIALNALKRSRLPIVSILNSRACRLNQRTA